MNHTVLEEAKALQETLVKDRRWVHMHAEIGEELPETSAYVKKRLEEIGCEYEEICDCGLVVTLGGKKGGKCILLRADMDALPIREESGEAFACTNGYAHACGHDMHTAMMLGTARILKNHEDELEGFVKLVFQPAEEIFRGAQKMLDAGLLENPKVDAAVTLHVNAMSSEPTGTLSIPQAGVSLASCDSYRIEIRGKGGHGAYPSETIDPISIGAHILTCLQQISAREVPATEAAVMTQGTFHSGKAPNIIPDTALIEGTLRTFSEETRQFCLKRMKEIVTSTGASMKAEAEFTVLGGCSPLVTDKAMRDAALRYMKELLGDGVAEKNGPPGMASEDFGNVLSKVPGFQFSLAVGSIKEGDRYPMHNPKVVMKEWPMYIGTAAMSYMALSWLKEQAE